MLTISAALDVLVSLDASVLAASRMDPLLLDLLLSAGLGLFTATVGVLLVYFGAKKRGKAMDGEFWQKFMLYGVCGMVVGYFSMRMAIKGNPELFHGKSPLSAKQAQRISEQPLSNLPKLKELKPPASHTGMTPLGPQTSTQAEQERYRKARESMSEERKQRLQQSREDQERRVQQMKSDHEQRVEQMKKDREARMARQKLEREVAQTAAKQYEEAERVALQGMSIEDLEKIKVKHQAAIDEARLQLQGVDVTAESRRKASKNLSEAVRAHLAVSEALADKRRQK